jgi:hypothetical protein
MTKPQVGDIIGIRHHSGLGTTDGYYYLITKTSSRFRYGAIFLPDGQTTELDKDYVAKYGVIIS